jgi:hypothetical protein
MQTALAWEGTMDKHVDTRKDVSEADDLGIGNLDDLQGLCDAAEAAEAARQRFALVFDATGSMGPWWTTTQEALKKAVEEIKARTSVPIQIKVVAYRDHCYTDFPVVEESEWSDDTRYLKNFITAMVCAGGGDYPESIGHGLKAILQQKCNMVILMGDAPSKEGSWGWDEAKTCAEDKCPIHALYVVDSSDVQECFGKIAKLSGGKAMHLHDSEGFDDVLKVLLGSAKALQLDYQPTSEEGKRIKALLG